MKTISTIITLLLLGSALQAQPGPCSGNGTFVDSGQAVGPGAKSSDVALADFDGDGDLDMVVANGVMNSQPTRVYFNDGLNSGNFVDSGQSLPANGSYAVAVGDINGDTHPDFVVANGQTQPNRVFFNDGNGNFTDSGQLLGNSYSADIALGDIDGDTDLDLIVANWAGQSNRIYINDGLNSGNFIDSQQSLVALNSAAVVLGDIDGDNDLDLIFGSNANYPSEIWINQGGAQQGNLGVFLVSPQTLGTSNATFCLVLDDLNGDSYPDLVQGNYDGTTSQLYFNDGTGNFTNSGQIIDTPGGGTMGVALGDVDGDLDLDLVYAKIGYNTVWINTGGNQGGIAGQFVNSFQTLGVSTPGGQTISSFSLALGDVDGDTDLDIVVVNYDQPNQVYLNVAGGGPDCNQNTIPDQCDIASGTSEDCNLNDIPDECEILANPSIDCDINGVIDSCELAIETTFVDSGQLLGTNYSLAVALGDVNGDGTLDMVVGNALNQANLIYSNDGSGNFTLWAQLPGLSSTLDIALGDINGDSHLDIVVANSIYQPNQVLFNDGNGNFIDSGQTLGSNYISSSVALGDVNGDGTLDMVVANSGDAWGVKSNFIYLNDGSGTFTNSNQSLGNSDSRSLALGDIDGDTDLDLVVANANGEANRVYINQGGLQSGNLGEFLDSNQQLGADNSRTVALGDLNDDGFIDIVVGNQPPGGAGSDLEIVRLNDGNGNFSNIHQTLDAGTFTAATALGDLDGDGALDLVVGNWATITGVYPKNIVKFNEFNTSSVVFPSSGFVALDPQGATFRDTFDLALGDVDGDSDLDIVVVNSAGYNYATGTMLANQVFFNNSAPSDCNENGIIDSCDISSGFSLDTNQNEIPDECEGMKYISGDGNGDGVVNVGDGIFVLDYLFGGGVSSCLDASDVNGDGVVDIGDAVYLLTYLFNGGSTPAAPFPECGEDPTADALECDGSTACP